MNQLVPSGQLIPSGQPIPGAGPAPISYLTTLTLVARGQGVHPTVAGMAMARRDDILSIPSRASRSPLEQSPRGRPYPGPSPSRTTHKPDRSTPRRP